MNAPKYQDQLKRMREEMLGWMKGTQDPLAAQATAKYSLAPGNGKGGN